AKAAKYREISQELQLWWHGLAADDYRRLSVEQETLAAQQSALETDLASINEAQKVLEHDEREFDQEMGRLDQRLRDADRRNAACREVIAGHVTTLTHQSARVQELDADIVRLRQQQTLLHQRTMAIHDEVTQKSAHLSVLETDANDMRTQLATQNVE